MKTNFKNFRATKDTPKVNILQENPELKNIIKKHVLLRSELSDNALVALVVKANGENLDEQKYAEAIEELNAFEYLKEKEITEKGNQYLESEEALTRLQQMV